MCSNDSCMQFPERITEITYGRPFTTFKSPTLTINSKFITFTTQTKLLYDSGKQILDMLGKRSSIFKRTQELAVKGDQLIGCDQVMHSCHINIPPDFSAILILNLNQFCYKQNSLNDVEIASLSLSLSPFLYVCLCACRIFTKFTISSTQ